MTNPAYSETGGVSESGCFHFHMTLYWSTISVLGRPRMVVEHNLTAVMLTGLVILVCFMIPRQLANVYGLLQQTTPHQRNVYKPSSKAVKHLVVVGHREFSSVNMLLYEIFHADRGQHPVRDVVLLFPQAPGRDLEWLIAHPAYVSHVCYLQGTPLQEKDLERASLATAAGVVVLANKDSAQPRWHDGELLTCIQSMKAYWLKDIVRRQRDIYFSNSREAAQKFLRPRIVCQVLLPETKEYLVELPSWTERDVVVVCGEYVAWMLGMAALARGMATLVFNLMSHTEKQKYYQTRWYPRYENGATQELYNSIVHHGGEMDGITLLEASLRLQKYRCILVAIELCDRPCPGTSTPSDASKPTRHHTGLHLFPGPQDLKVLGDDRLICIARSAPALREAMERLGGVTLEAFEDEPHGEHPGHRNELHKDLSMSEVDRPWVSETQIDQAVPWEDDERMECLPMAKRHLPRGCEYVPSFEELDKQALDRFDSSSSSQLSCPMTPGRNKLHELSKLDEHTDGESSLVQASSSPADLEMVRQPAVEKLVESQANIHSDDEFGHHCCLDNMPLSKDDVLNRLRCQQPPWVGHIVMCGLPQTQAARPGGRGLVTELFETLKRIDGSTGQRQRLIGIVIIDDEAEAQVADLCLAERTVMDMLVAGQLRAVSADPRSRDMLLQRTSLGSARAVIALPEHVSRAMPRELSTVETTDGKARRKMVKQIVDTNTVLTMQVARSCAQRGRLNRTSRRVMQRFHCVTLLLQESTSSLFFGHANMRHAGAASTVDPRWMDISPLNMSPLFAAGELLAMTCFDRFAVEALFQPQVVPLLRMLIFGDQQGHRLHQIECPTGFVGEPYEAAVTEMCTKGQMLIGIMRFPESGSTVDFGEVVRNDLEALPDAVLPYVMTNPDANEVVLRASDLLFVVGKGQQAPTHGSGEIAQHGGDDGALESPR
eukprot:CAMPEP_0195159442 /NCGR_PEP_ID=MMETSP0448-20130528/186166_1 /TAXON_ID=66468 /ORGANISM="Heterocapsa triquestra, Strain CCMP 448" /LENGTH=943 /DNA_ID=CAMNT_0040198241 /DNA_START=45 /DNA_END=2876 /DNA_ORIENTATION=+